MSHGGCNNVPSISAPYLLLMKPRLIPSITRRVKAVGVFISGHVPPLRSSVCFVPGCPFMCMCVCGRVYGMILFHISLKSHKFQREPVGLTLARGGGDMGRTGNR